MEYRVVLWNHRSTASLVLGDFFNLLLSHGWANPPADSIGVNVKAPLDRAIYG